MDTLAVLNSKAEVALTKMSNVHKLHTASPKHHDKFWSTRLICKDPPSAAAQQKRSGWLQRLAALFCCWPVTRWGARGPQINCICTLCLGTRASSSGGFRVLKEKQRVASVLKRATASCQRLGGTLPARSPCLWTLGRQLPAVLFHRAPATPDLARLHIAGRTRVFEICSSVTSHSVICKDPRLSLECVGEKICVAIYDKTALHTLSQGERSFIFGFCAALCDLDSNADRFQPASKRARYDLDVSKDLVMPAVLNATAAVVQARANATSSSAAASS